MSDKWAEFFVFRSLSGGPAPRPNGRPGPSSPNITMNHIIHILLASLLCSCHAKLQVSSRPGETATEQRTLEVSIPDEDVSVEVVRRGSSPDDLSVEAVTESRFIESKGFPITFEVDAPSGGVPPTGQPSKRYSVEEIDELRKAVENRYIWGNANGPRGSAFGTPYRESDKAAVVEQQVRTYMLAGVTAQELKDADK